MYSNWLFQENPKCNINRFVLQECGDFTWRVSDCEELSGSYSQGNDGVDGGDFTWRVVNMD